MKKSIILTIILLTGLIIIVISLVYVAMSKGIFLISKESQWSIGIFTGDSPYDLSAPANIDNPVLTAGDVKDVYANFVADPFMIQNDSKWYMFFEVMNALSGHGDIGLAVSDDGLNWSYKQIVLDEPFHLSYPYVFKWKDNYYMIPESHQANSVRLYKAVKFPTKWKFIDNLLIGNYVDPSIFYYNGIWWLFVGNTKYDTLRLFYTYELTGPWLEHDKSPIIEDNANIAQPGGRVLVLDTHIIRYTQDDDPTYGKLLRAYEIRNLTTTDYVETEVSENPILKAARFGWNGHGMHHIDPHLIDENKWLASVDGYKKYLTIKIEY